MTAKPRDTSGPAGSTALEERLKATLAAVADQTAAPVDGFGLIQGRLEDGAPSAYPVGTGSARRRWLAVAAAVLVVGGGGTFLLARLGPDRTAATDGQPASTLPSAPVPSATVVPLPDEPLHLLPPEGTDLSAGVQWWESEESVDEGTAVLVVGRPTADGYENMVLISHLTSGPTFGEFEGDEVTIAGRPFRQPDYAAGSNAAEQLPDGSWIEYYAQPGTTALADAAARTSYDGTTVRFAPTDDGIRQLARVDGPAAFGVGPGQGTQILYPGREHAPEATADWFSLSTGVVPVPGEAALLAFGVFGRSMSETTVAGNPGYLIAMDSGGGPAVGLVWQVPSGHVVFLSTGRSEAEARAFAENLREVDGAIWNAELAAVAAATESP